MKIGAVLFGLISSLTWAHVSAADSRPEFPANATVTTSDAKCSTGFTPAPSGDNESITFIFSNFQLIPSNPRLTCLIGIDYKFPIGWRLWRPSINVRGFQSLNNKKENAVWVIRTRLNGGAWQSQNLLTKGPVSDDFQIDLQGGEPGGESPTRCGAKSAHIDVEIIAALFPDGSGKPDQDPLMALDAIDTQIDWQRCKP